MNRIIIAKISEISAGLGFVFLGILFFLLGIVSMIYGDLSLFLAVVLLVMAISGIELGFFWTKRFYKMAGGLEVRPPERLVAIAASKAVYLIFVVTLFRILFAIIGFFVAYYFVIKYILMGIGELDLLNVIIYCGVLILYFAVLRMLFRPKLKEKSEKLMKKVTADYPKVEVRNDNLIINLGIGYPENSRILTIPLEMIDDIKLLDRYQGIGLVKYVLGPDLEFGARTVKDKMDYLQGKIERPKFFSYLQNASGAKTLYLAGPEILYLFGVQEDFKLPKQLLTSKF